MEHYISKSALVAEIERLKVHSEEAIQEFGREGYIDNVLFEQSKIRICEKLLSLLDTLEAKEVDSQIEPQVKESAEIQHVNETCKENGNSLTLDGVITFDYYEGDKAYGCVAHDSFCYEDLGLKDRDEVKILILKK